MLVHEFLATAQRLAAGTSEGDWRSAISRAYYACFHYFIDFLRSHGISLPKSGSAHQLIYQSLNNSGVTALASIANRYLDFQKKRNAADYDDAPPPAKSDADDALRLADRILADFEAELLNTPAAAIASGIRAYLVTSGRIRP